MSILNIMCPICTEVFKNPDDIYSTSCGHIFHFSCMNGWQRRGTSCPQCRQYNPTTHKLYLSFDESEESSRKMEEIQLKLKSSNEKNAQLICQLNEKFIQICNIEDNFLHLQRRYTESSELVKDLQIQIQTLSIEHECKVQELRLKSLEIESFKAGLEAENKALSDKKTMLEQKWKNVSADLDKERQNCLNISLEYEFTKDILVKVLKSERELIIENRRKSKELTLKSSESELFQAGLDTEKCVLSDKIRSLEQKLKVVSEALEMERKNSLNLTLENEFIQRIYSESQNPKIKVDKGGFQ